MPAPSLSDQLHRIGGLAAACVVAALALGTFALLRRIIPASRPAAAPTTVTPARSHIQITPATAGTAAAAAAGQGNDPLAAAQQQTLKQLTRSQQQQIALSHKQATAVSRGISTLSKHHPKFPVTPHVPRRVSSSSGSGTSSSGSGGGSSAKSSTTPQPSSGKTTTAPTGGAGVQGQKH